MSDPELNTAKAILLGMDGAGGGGSFPAPGDNGRDGESDSQTASEYVVLSVSTHTYNDL